MAASVTKNNVVTVGTSIALQDNMTQQLELFLIIAVETLGTIDLE